MPDLLLLYDDLLNLLWQWRWPLVAGLVLLVLRELRGIDRETRLHALLMSLIFFLIITSYWILKPLKKGAFLAYYELNPLHFLGSVYTAAQAELLAKEINVALALLAALLFSRLSRLLLRERLFLFLAFSFGGFFLLLAKTGDFHDEPAIWSLYLSGDLYVTVLVAAFFAFLNDSEMPGRAKRLYGLIGLGGTLGGLAGSTLVAGHASSLDVNQGLLMTLALIVMMSLPALWAGRIVRRHPPVIQTPPEAQPRFWGRVSRFFSGIDVVARSRYLMAIAAMMGLYEMVSTLVDYQFSTTIVHFVAADRLGDAFSRVYSFTNLVAVLAQLLLTRMLLTRLGVGPTLVLLPAAILVGSFGYLLLPVLLFGALLNTLDNGFAYSVNQSAKEVLYVPVSPGDKYRAKAFIDIFVLRAAKAFAILLSGVVSLWFASFEQMRWLSLGVILLLSVWLVLTHYLGKAYQWREAQALGKVQAAET
jgi:AAA family ATP:ADP antiporter